jgi:hypothetical protein
MISRLYILQAGLIAGPTKIKELFYTSAKIIIIIIADKYHAPAFACYINEFMIVLVYTSSHVIKQQKRDKMRGSVCLDIFMEFGTSFFLHCMNIYC